VNSTEVWVKQKQ